ncbi:MAG: DedA family protein [Chloroflexota bacterium]
MDFLTQLFDFIVHLDAHLQSIITQYGTLSYLILFAVLFAETGLVVTPFLPGDSLLFAAGTLAAVGALKLPILLAVSYAAVILGDTVNYAIGKYIGPRAFSGNSRFLKQSHLQKTQDFFEKHGGKAIILARFVPIVRTFAPFVAGVGTMNYSRFLAFNVIGGFAWVTAFTLLGYFFGNIPIVRDNLVLVIPAIILLSLLPIGIEFIRGRSHPETAEQGTSV